MATKCRMAAEGASRRAAMDRKALGWTGPRSGRNATPSIVMLRMDAGTKVTPSPLATKLSADMIRGASWPRRGLNPASAQAARVASYSAGPCCRA